MGDGTFQAAVNYAAGTNPTSLVVGDFNGDGKPDLVTTNRGNNNNVSVLLGNGDVTFQTAVKLRRRREALLVTVGDFNAYGKPDLVAPNFSDNGVSVLLNTTVFPKAVTSTTLTRRQVRYGDQTGPYRMVVAVGPHPAIVLPAAHRPSVPKAYQIPANISVSPVTNAI